MFLMICVFLRRVFIQSPHDNALDSEKVHYLLYRLRVVKAYFFFKSVKLPEISFMDDREKTDVRRSLFLSLYHKIPLFYQYIDFIIFL